MSTTTVAGTVGGIFSILIIAWVSSQVFPVLDKTVDNTLQNQPALQQSYDTTRTIQDTAGTLDDAKQIQKDVVIILAGIGIGGGIIGAFKILF